MPRALQSCLLALLLGLASTHPSRAADPSMLAASTGPSATPGWRLPPIGPVTRTYPHLVNYHHMALADGQVDHKEERLAQWDVVILNPDHVRREKLSLPRLREINPRIRILAWIPLQGPTEDIAPGMPPEGQGDWYARTATGQYRVPHWGGHLMNPYIGAFAWPKHLLAYIRKNCLEPGLYDGVMLDCLWVNEPDGCDVNGDGVCNAADRAAWREAMAFLTRTLREQFPKAIITGNGGVPWPAGCDYYRWANGCMHENALGDQFGGPDWGGLWRGGQTGLGAVKDRAPYHFLAVDVRMNRRNQADAAKLSALTPDDLRRMRLGLGTSLLREGLYFGFDRGDCLHGQLWWFDEYDADLGEPKGPCQANVYGPGTFSRQFARGMVLVNPTAQPVTARLPASARDATTRQVGTTLLVPAQDARIGLWQAAR